MFKPLPINQTLARNFDVRILFPGDTPNWLNQYLIATKEIRCMALVRQFEVVDGVSAV